MQCPNPYPHPGHLWFNGDPSGKQEYCQGVH